MLKTIISREPIIELRLLSAFEYIGDDEEAATRLKCSQLDSNQKITQTDAKYKKE
jgi:hypothetical protein